MLRKKPLRRPPTVRMTTVVSMPMAWAISWSSGLKPNVDPAGSTRGVGCVVGDGRVCGQSRGGRGKEDGMPEL